MVLGYFRQGDIPLQMSLHDLENQGSSSLTTDLVRDGCSWKGLIFGHHNAVSMNVL